LADRCSVDIIADWCNSTGRTCLDSLTSASSPVGRSSLGTYVRTYGRTEGSMSVQYVTAGVVTSTDAVGRLWTSGTCSLNTVESYVVAAVDGRNDGQ
jgi:hypothetical protein